MNWNEGNQPSESGYYLATWKYMGDGRSKAVSELWFDGERWWSRRHYFPDGLHGITKLANGMDVTDFVIAWSKKPKPYRK